MSQTQVDATALFCRLLERAKPEINGQALRLGADAVAAKLLLHERVLVHGALLDWVTCPECGVQTARVVQDKSKETIALLCPECGDVEGPRPLRETYKVALQKFVVSLLNGLGFSLNGMKPIVPDLIWRLGTTEAKRGKAVTWYFARRLLRPEVASRLREQINLDQSAQSCVILTSSETPLPAGSALTEFDVRPLFTVGRVGQNTFEFFQNRQADPGPQILDEAVPGTTLRYVRDQGKVFIEGAEYLLDPTQKNILVALIDDHDHEMGNDAIKTSCGSQAQRFSPSKAFDKNEATQRVYRTFVIFQRGDERYRLIIPENDHDWLR
ncbi:MAG: hypothetical protein Q8O33_06480 [Pseudomonadota bacterium]|nr:hypothetical protein [Pseudomonadota bacterium]